MLLLIIKITNLSLTFNLKLLKYIQFFLNFQLTYLINTKN